MNIGLARRLQRLRWLLWVISPMLLVAAVAVGSIVVFDASAASPVSKHYKFRGITTTGPVTGLSLMGSLALMVDGSGNVTGNICNLKIATQSCDLVSGTLSQSIDSIAMTIGHLNGYFSLLLTGKAVNTSGKRSGFEGVFTLGASQGTWEARNVAIPQLSGSWDVSGVVKQGTDMNKQFHGVMDLIQQSNGQVSGAYCPVNGACVSVTGGKDTGNFFFYINIVVLKQVIRFHGTALNAVALHIDGSFESLNPNVSTADKGDWLGHFNSI